jgi:hypothetical protein
VTDRQGPVGIGHLAQMVGNEAVPRYFAHRLQHRLGDVCAAQGVDGVAGVALYDANHIVPGAGEVVRGLRWARAEAEQHRGGQDTGGMHGPVATSIGRRDHDGLQTSGSPETVQFAVFVRCSKAWRRC